MTGTHERSLGTDDPQDEEQTMARLAPLDFEDRNCPRSLPQGWMVFLRIESTDGSILHPALAERARKSLHGHVAGIRSEPRCISIICSIETVSPDAAAAEADELAEHLRQDLHVQATSIFGPVLYRYKELDEYFADDAIVSQLGR